MTTHWLLVANALLLAATVSATIYLLHVGQGRARPPGPPSRGSGRLWSGFLVLSGVWLAAQILVLFVLSRMQP